MAAHAVATAEKWVGVVVSGSGATVVTAEVKKGQPLKIEKDQTLSLQDGSRPAAYAALYERVRVQLRSDAIKKVVIKGSGTSGRGMGMSHLEGAEVRGVVMAAAASVGATIEVLSAASLSRNFGSRKVGEYLKDDAFFSAEICGKLRSGSREAAFQLIASSQS